MFDIITRRRLIIFLFAVLFVILSIFIFWSYNSIIFNYSLLKVEDKQELSECYLTEPVEVIVTLCQKCTSYERRSKANACLPTGYKE